MCFAAIVFATACLSAVECRTVEVTCEHTYEGETHGFNTKDDIKTLKDNVIAYVRETLGIAERTTLEQSINTDSHLNTQSRRTRNTDLWGTVTDFQETVDGTVTSRYVIHLVPKRTFKMKNKNGHLIVGSKAKKENIYNKSASLAWMNRLPAAFTVNTAGGVTFQCKTKSNYFMPKGFREPGDKEKMNEIFNDLRGKLQQQVDNLQRTAPEKYQTMLEKAETV